MKKQLLLFILFLNTFFFFGQTLINEDFTSGISSWTPNNNASNWVLSNTNNAGGTAPEVKLTSSPNFNTTSRFVSPYYDTTGHSTLILSFKHNLVHYSGSFVVGVATRVNEESWHTAWYMMGADISESRTITISNTDVGQNNFQFCMFFSGNTSNLTAWYFDDINLYVPLNKDISMLSINNSSVINAGDNYLSATYKNYGVSTITSFDMNYQINGGATVTENVSGLNLTFGQQGTYVMTTPFTAVPGGNVAHMWITNINGSGDDELMSNNTLTKTLSVPIATVAKMPLYEEFTSSTCGPCASFNGSVFNAFMSSNTNTINVVKYQMNWPGSGDPYYTAEGGTRRTYYGVSAVPDLFVGGNTVDTSSSAVNAAFTTETNEPTYFSINAIHQISGSNFNIDITVTPYVTGEFVLHTAVIENLTTGNVSSNGETSFKNVMMKMLPNANGATVNLVAGTNYTVSYSQNMSATHVEQMSDLKAVVFLQNVTSKKVYQSAYSSPQLSSEINELQQVAIYPNPTQDKVYVHTDKPLQVVVYDILGKTVYSNQAIDNQQAIDLSNLQKGVYFISLSNGNASITKKLIRS